MNTAKTLGIGTFLSIGSPTVTEIVSLLGFDWLLLDMEHGLVDEGSLLDNLRAIRAPQVRAIVRVPEASPRIIARVLDLGADGIMVPHVDSAATARAVVDAMYYPPKGSRGLSTSVRAMDFGLSPVKDTSTWEGPLLLTQIESREGVEAAGEIAATPGVDLLFVGPRDLSLDLSVRSNPMDFDMALSIVAQAANAHGKQAGILVRDPANRPKLEAMGYSALAMGSDMGALKSGYRQLF